jgi:predicted secreted Zn-dependent protease
LNNKFFWIPAFAVVAMLSVNLSADELLLKEGKTLTGKIVKEDEVEYTIRLSHNMYLRVEKTKVVKVTKDQPESEATPLTQTTVKKAVTVSTTSATTAATATPTPSSTAAVPNPSPVASAAKIPDSEIRTKDRTNHGFKISEQVINKIYTVRGDTMDAIKSDILDSEKGKGVKVGNKREASGSEWITAWNGASATEEGKFKWKSGVVVATITVTLPSWKAADNANPETIKAWNDYFASVNGMEEGRAKIYSQALDNFCESLVQLRESSEDNLKKESNKLYEQMKSQVENRQQGYLRRLQFRPPPSRKH